MTFINLSVSGTIRNKCNITYWNTETLKFQKRHFSFYKGVQTLNEANFYPC